VTGSLTGTRTFFVGPKNTILVAGTNKIVASEAAALKRLHDYQLPVESARARDVYKVPASALNFVEVLRGPNPFSKGNVHVIFIKGSFGY